MFTLPRTGQLAILTLLAALGLAAAATTAPGAEGAAGTAPHAGAPLGRQQAQLPCGLQADRSLQPLIVEEDGEIAISVDYRYDCPTADRKANVLLLVENSRALERTGWQGRQLLPNLRDGLEDFVNEINFDIGSRSGFILFSATESVRVPLAAEGSGRQAVISAAKALQPSGANSAAGIAPAVDEAVRQLEAADPAATTARFAVIVQAGAPWASAEQAIATACTAAKAKGVTIGLLTLDGVDNPLTDCASRGWSLNSPRDNGEDIPPNLVELGTRIRVGHQAREIAYCDEINRLFGFVEGSAIPRPPDSVVLDEHCWFDEPPSPPGGHTLTYRLKAGEAAPNTIGPASVASEVRLTLRDGTIFELPLAAPDVCVFRSGQAQFCEPFALTLTPGVAPTEATSAPTTAQPSTDVPPTAAHTHTPTPSDTAQTPEPSPTAPDGTTPTLGWRLYIPVADRRA